MGLLGRSAPTVLDEGAEDILGCASFLLVVVSPVLMNFHHVLILRPFLRVWNTIYRTFCSFSGSSRPVLGVPILSILFYTSIFFVQPDTRPGTLLILSSLSGIGSSLLQPLSFFFCSSPKYSALL